MNVEDRMSLLVAAFVEKIATFLSDPAATIQARNSLSAYGLDCVVAVEFLK